ncbi:hypothetical protein JZ751_008191 [Albula glossodonta]|uniref:Uncharacterized protein n=1 Tax=Albula glossodonta TaxID=121402 RepID=A0A8T2N9L7_9TELE|nr:hypothetical protein JZ751_008191 [Albula glossodonta]
METNELLPPLPLEPPDAMNAESLNCTAPPPPPLQTSSDAEEMDVSSGGDGHTHTPAGDGREPAPKPQLHGRGSAPLCGRLAEESEASAPCPRTARHAPPVTKFLPDLKLLKDVKISVSFTESSRSKDRKVLYTGVGQEKEEEEEGGDGGHLGCGEGVNGELHDPLVPGPVSKAGIGNGALGAGKKGEEAEPDLENKVEFAVLDELDDFTENFLETEDGDQGGFRSQVIVQQEQADEEVLNYSYEVVDVHLLSPYLMAGS